MKKTFTFLTLLTAIVWPGYGQSQHNPDTLRVAGLQQIAEVGIQPKLSPAGDYVIVNNAGTAGLTRIDVATGERTVIAPETDIDSDITFSDGGRLIAYRTTSYRDHIRYNTIKVTDVQTGKIQVLDEPSRERFAFRFAGGTMRIAKRTTIRSQRLLTDIRNVEHAYVLAVEEDDLVLYDGKVRKVLNPNGQNIYLWQQISPDEKRIVYVAVNDGCHTFVCNIDGSNVVDLGHYIGAPTWLGNDWIIGQQDEDDGHRMTASRLVAIHPDGTDFQIIATPELQLPVNPNASRDGKVVFENNGQIYLMQLQ
jgi:hypothetical protein